MIRYISIVLLLSSQYVGAIQVNVPNGWTRMETPRNLPSSIKSLLKVVSPDKDAEVTITDYEIVMSLDEAAESLIRGMAGGGYQHTKTANITVNGYPARHIQGKFPINAGKEIIPTEAYILLTDDSIVSVGVSGLEASSLIGKVVPWVEFPAGGVTVDTEAGSQQAGRSIWEYIGIIVVLGAVVYAIYNSTFSSKKTG